MKVHPNDDQPVIMEEQKESKEKQA